MANLVLRPASDLQRVEDRWLGLFSEHTARGYKRDVAEWFAWCDTHGVDPNQATGRDVLEHLAGLELAQATKARRCSAIMSFYAYARDEGATQANPVPPKHQRPTVKGLDAARHIGLSAKDAVALQTAADAHSERASGLIAVLLTTGLRITEALSIDTLAAGSGGRVTVTVLGKGSKLRTVVVPPMAVERCAGLGTPLFTTRTGRRMRQQDAYALMKTLGKRAGLDGLFPHLMRHTAASLSIAGGTNIVAVQAMLGHASLSTTQLYAQAAGMLDNSPAYALAALVSPPQERLPHHQGEHNEPRKTPVQDA